MKRYVLYHFNLGTPNQVAQTFQAVFCTRTPVPSFDTRMSYLSFAPSFRIDQHLIPNLSFRVGPFLNANLKGTYVYKPDINKPAVEPEADVTLRNVATYGIQGGLGYTITLAQLNNKNDLILVPFVDASLLVNQRKSLGMPVQNSINDIWSTVSYRFGVKLAINFTPNADEPFTETGISHLGSQAEVTPAKKASVIMPDDNVITTKNVKGYFPIHPYVFFDKESQDIPARYTLLSKSEAINFNESELGNFMKGDLTTKETNVNQLMRTYYNLINIYGDRMRKNPSTKLTLKATDPEEKEALSSANKIKDYLVNIFGISPDRITIIEEQPKKISGSASTDPSFKKQIDDENRRVVFVFSDPAMLKPVSYTIRDESSIDNDLVFSIDKGVAFKSWDVTIKGEGKSMYFGPYSYRSERINPAEMMRYLESGKYVANVTITDSKGKKSDENFEFKLSKERELKVASRYLMIFDYNQSDPIGGYEKTIRKEITPGIASGQRVIVHGHTDNIGNVEDNLKLSQERAEMAKSIIDDELVKENRKINVSALGIGQTIMDYSFDNKYPEGRMYNRNVFVEIY